MNLRSQRSASSEGIPLNGGGAKAASDDILWGADSCEDSELEDCCPSDIAECVSVNVCEMVRPVVVCSSGIKSKETVCDLLRVVLSVSSVSGSDDGTVASRLKTGSLSSASSDGNDEWRVLCAGRRTVNDCGVGDGVVTANEPGVVLAGDGVDARTSGAGATSGAVADRKRGSDEARAPGALPGRGQSNQERRAIGVV